MGNNQLADQEWARHYERADCKRRQGKGDPFIRHVHRVVNRGRALFAGAILFAASMLTAFYVILVR